MNPLERLRYIARIEGEDPVDLALEATYAIAELAYDRAMLVSALRRLLDRHPHFGITWTIASRVLGSVFPEEEAWGLVSELSALRVDRGLVRWPSLQLDRRGGVKVLEDVRTKQSIGFDIEAGIELLRARPDLSLVIESDLVSSRFALIPFGGSFLMEEFSDGSRDGGIIIHASSYSLVPASIRESLESRLAAIPKGQHLELVDLEGSYGLSYLGENVSPVVVDRMVGWKVPQEVLRPAGPLLG